MARAVMSGAEGGGEMKVAPLVGKPDLAVGRYDVRELGYAMREFLITGDAAAYRLLDRDTDGASWTVAPFRTAPFSTRAVLLAPEEPARFNGTLVVEWFNVSGALDAPVVWHMAHREITRSGYAYLGVSVQKAGIDGGPSSTGRGRPLKKADPARYAGLHHPGDAYAFGIFTQVGRLLRSPGAGQLLGPLEPAVIMAAGESQSAAFLTTYVNAVAPLASFYDGYLIHSRLGGGAPLDGSSILAPPPDTAPQVMPFRTELPAPVMAVITETDLLGGDFLGGKRDGYFVARRPPTERLRIWEIAGTAHADNYNYVVSFIDSGLLPIEALAAAYRPNRSASGPELDLPMNFGPQHHYVLEAAFAGLDAWIRTGAPPPQPAPLEVMPGSPPRLATDAFGLARGGVRTPWIDVPAARLAGYGNSGDDRAFLVGVGEQFDQATLDKLYPGGRSDYLKRFEAALTSAIGRGFILEADREEILTLAALSYHGLR